MYDDARPVWRSGRIRPAALLFVRKETSRIQVCCAGRIKVSHWPSISEFPEELKAVSVSLCDCATRLCPLRVFALALLTGRHMHLPSPASLPIYSGPPTAARCRYQPCHLHSCKVVPVIAHNRLFCTGGVDHAAWTTFNGTCVLPSDVFLFLKVFFSETCCPLTLPSELMSKYISFRAELHALGVRHTPYCSCYYLRQSPRGVRGPGGAMRHNNLKGTLRVRDNVCLLDAERPSDQVGIVNFYEHADFSETFNVDEMSKP